MGLGWVPVYTIGVAYARLMYEHWRYGRCYTRYYGLTCPVCGKRS